METAGYFLIAFALAMVPFSVALKSAVFRCVKWPESLTMAFLFGFFQSVMLAAGFLVGWGLKGLFFQITIPVALMLMLFISLRMIVDARRAGDARRTVSVESSRMLVVFSLVIGINAFLLGIGLGMVLNLQFLFFAIVFGMVFLFTLLGSRMGKLGFVQWPFVAEILGGCALLILTAVTLLQYLKII